MSSPKIRASLGWLLILLVATDVSRVQAQQSVPTQAQTGQQNGLPVHAVSIRFAQWVGFCGGCYCGAEVEASPQGVTLFKNALRECQQQNPRKYRDFRVHADISGKHWKELEQLAGKDTLFALPNSTGCASCVDGIDELVEVRFSDGTKKSVQYPAGTPPKEIKALCEKLLSLLHKLQDELVNTASSRL
jgi:hypothetical protein